LESGVATSERKSVLEQIRVLKEQEATLIDGAKAEAIAKAKEAIGELQELGFHYRLIEGGEEYIPRARNATTVAQIKRQQKDAPCPICGFKTTPLHDGRAHRSQEKKKPFTKSELSERGLAKVG
jgi:hypothetical protein